MTEEMELVDQWKGKYEHQHGLYIDVKDELDAAKRALAELVACKNLKEAIAADSFPAHEAEVLHAEYKVRQPLALALARAILAAKSPEVLK